MTDTDTNMNTSVASLLCILRDDDDDWNVLPVPASPLLPSVDRQLLMDSSENVGFVVNGLSAQPHQTVKNFNSLNRLH